MFERTCSLVILNFRHWSVASPYAHDTNNSILQDGEHTIRSTKMGAIRCLTNEHKNTEN